ncbi:MAG: MFS transporter, partial [Pyrinomonadaceae bacterium]
MHYGWVVVAVSFVTMSLVSPIGTTFQLFYQALKEQFQWSHAGISGIYGLHQFLNGAVSPFVGGLLDRYGARRVMPLGALIVGIGVAASSQVTSLWQLYVTFGLVTAFGVAMLQSVPNAAVISNWFVRNRGTAVGLALAGSGLGQLWLTPATQWLIVRTGWRTALLLTAPLVFVVPALLILLFLYHRPADKGLLPYGETEEEKRKAKRDLVVVDKAWAETVWTPRRAARTRRFWAMAAMTFVFSLGFFLVSAQLFVLTQELETFQAQSIIVALIIGAQGLHKGAAKFFGGVLSDRWGREKTFTVSVGLIIAGILLLNLVRVYPSAGLLYVAVLIYGIGYGFCLTAMMAAYADLFHGPRLGAILGYFTLAGLLGAALGTGTGGYLRDVTGGYQTNFLISAIAFGLSVALMWGARPGGIRTVRKLTTEAGPGT